MDKRGGGQTNWSEEGLGVGVVVKFITQTATSSQRDGISCQSSRQTGQVTIVWQMEKKITLTNSNTTKQPTFTPCDYGNIYMQ